MRKKRAQRFKSKILLSVNWQRMKTSFFVTHTTTYMRLKLKIELCFKKRKYSSLKNGRKPNTCD